MQLSRQEAVLLCAALESLAIYIHRAPEEVKDKVIGLLLEEEMDDWDADGMLSLINNLQAKLSEEFDEQK